MNRPFAVALTLAGLAALAAGACTERLEADGARAYARVVHQVEAGPRIPGTPGHAAIHRWIADELERLGARVELQDGVDSTLGRPMPLRNLIGRFGPPAGRPIVLAAHWDSRPFSDQDPDSTHRFDPVPGANDGASGVAVLLEVAEELSRRPPRVPVELVFFDGEDQGPASALGSFCLGSKLYARSLGRRPHDRWPLGVFLFDMVGDRDLEIRPELTSMRRAANLVAIVHDAARATGATHFVDTPGYAIYDDHIPLLEAGVPAVDIIDFEYGAWHTHRDLPDQVAPESLAEVARVALWIVYRSPLARP